MRVHGVTGSADVSSIAIQQLEVGELLMGATTLPIVPDVFGGAVGLTVHGMPPAAARWSVTDASDSSTPRVTRSLVAVTPERMNLEK